MNYFSATVLSLCVSTLAAADIAPNPGFERVNPQNGFAADWNGSVAPGVTGQAALETVNVRNGKSAVRLEKSAGKGNVVCERLIRFPKPTQGLVRCTVSYALCGANLGKAYVVFFSGTPAKMQRQWLNLGTVQGSFEWKHFSRTIELEPGSTHVALSFRLTDPGTLFIDDVSIELAEPESAASFDFSGAPDAATHLPQGWAEQKYHGNENASTVRLVSDGGRVVAEQQWHSGAAKAGLVRGDLPPEFFALPAVKLAGSVQTEGNGAAALGVEFLDAQGNVIGEALSEPVRSKAFKRVEVTFARMPEAKSFRILLLNTGEGTVRFDGATLSAGAVKDACNTMRNHFEVKLFPVSTSLDQLGEADTVNQFLDSPIGIAFHFKGDRNKVKQPALVIDVPVALKLADVYTSHPWQYRIEKFSAEPLKRPEGDYTRYRIADTRAMQIMQPNGFAFQRKNIVTLMPADAKLPPSAHKIFYHLENGGTAAPESAFTLRCLPPMAKTPNPKRFKMMRWDCEDMNFGSDEVLAAARRCLEESNYVWRRRFDDTFPRAREIDAQLSEAWRFYLPGAPSGLEGNYAEAWKSIAPEFAVNADGKSRRPELCPEFVVSEPKFIPLRDEIIRKNIAARNPVKGDYLILDFEDWDPMNWCFCDRCRTAFAKFAKLSAVPETAAIKKEHAPAWRDFRRTNGVGKIKMIGDVVRKHFPGLLFGDYSYVADYSKPDYENFFYSVAKDAVWNAPYLDMQMPSYYHLVDAKGFDMMKIGRAKLKNEYIPIGAIDGVTGYLSKGNVLDPNRFRMMCLNAASTGCAGISVYPGDHVDGKYLLAIDRAMAEIASSEEYLLDGVEDARFHVKTLPFRTAETVIGGEKTMLEFPRWSNYARFNTHKLERGSLLSLLNHNPSLPLFVEISADLPSEYAIIDRISRTRIPRGEATTLVEVAPGDVRFLEFTATAPDYPAAQSQPEVRKRFQAAQDAFNQADRTTVFSPKQQDGYTFSWSDANGDKHPEIELANSAQKILIDLDRGGSLLDWVVGKESLTGLRPNFLIAESKLWLPESVRRDPAEKAPCRFLDAGVDAQGGFVTIERDFSLLPLRERKTYRLDRSSRLSVDFHFTNTGKNPVTFSFWCRNIFDPGTNVNAMTGIDFRADTRQPEGESCFIPKSQLTSANATAKFTHRNLQLDVALPFPDLQQFYYWRTPGLSTWEWMLREITLPPASTFSTTAKYSLTH